MNRPSVDVVIHVHLASKRRATMRSAAADVTRWPKIAPIVIADNPPVRPGG